MLTIKKGTEPIIQFALPISADNVQKAKVIIKYKDNSKLTKYAEADSFSGNTISVKLTQEETFLFDCNSYIKVLLRVLTKSGEPLVSDVHNVFVEECFDDEVLK